MNKIRGENHYNWKGDNVKCGGLHRWITRHKPKPRLCEYCLIKPPYDLANISPKYDKSTYTRDFKNWEWLCRSCHMKKDGRINLFKLSGIHNYLKRRGLWTEDEINYLKKNYKKVNYRLIAKRIKKTHFAVRHKASKLGLKSGWRNEN